MNAVSRAINAASKFRGKYIARAHSNSALRAVIC
jgi:hypothetical protein